MSLPSAPLCSPSLLGPPHLPLLFSLPDFFCIHSQWARDLFEGLFVSPMTELQDYVNDPQFLPELAKQPQQLSVLNNLKVNGQERGGKKKEIKDVEEWKRKKNELQHYVNHLTSSLSQQQQQAQGQK